MMKRTAFALIGGILLIALMFSPLASATAQFVHTTTAQFDAGQRLTSANYFADNGVDQPSNWIVYPNSHYYNGRTYVAWQAEENYSMWVRYYDHTNGAWGTAKRVVNGGTENPVTGDGHGSPALLVDSLGFIHLFCCAHDTAIQHYKTTAGQDISNWIEKPEITGTTAATTYPHPILVGTDIYLIFRNGNSLISPWAYRQSTTNGDSWNAVTDFLDFSALNRGAYIGGTDTWADQIHMAAVMYHGVDGERYNSYEMWINTTNGNVFCAPGNGVSAGPVITKLEADTLGCAIQITESPVPDLNTNFGAVHVNSTGTVHVTWRQQWASGVWDQTGYDHRFARSNATGFWNPQNRIIGTDNVHNYGDFIVSGPNVEAWLTTNTTTSLGSGHEGGDIQRWLWDGATWTLSDVTYRQSAAGKPLTAPIVPRNHHADFEIYFNQRHFDVHVDAGPANARLYGWSDNGFVEDAGVSFGAYTIETNTDCPRIASGDFQLGSIRCDIFSVADSDGITWKWGNSTQPEYGSNSALIAASAISRSVANGELNITLDANTGNLRTASVLSVPLAGDFNVSVRSYQFAGPTSFSTGMYVNLFNEPVVDGFSPLSTTVDGVLYYRESGGSLQTYTVTNGVETFIGTSDSCGGLSQSCWLAIKKVGTAITWYYRHNADSGAWIQDQTTTFATDNELFLLLVVFNNDVASVQFGFDSVNIQSEGFTATGIGGYRRIGEWSTPTRVFDGEIVKNVTVNYTGASSTQFIDKIAVVNNGTGETLFLDDTDRTSGTTVTVSIPDSDLVRLHGFDWVVRVTIKADGNGSMSVQEIVINTLRSTLQIAIADMPWILIFVAMITVAMIGAYAIKRKRGGGE